PGGDQRCFPSDGDRRGSDVGHHQSPRTGDHAGDQGSGCADGSRSGLCLLDTALPATRQRGQRKTPGRPPPIGGGMSSCQVVFTPSGRRGEVLRGTTVLEAARILGVDLDTVCGGRGICGRCQVVQGTNPAVPFRTDAFSPPGPTETEYRGRRPLADGARLGCATAILSDVVVDVPPESQIHRQVI